MPQHGKLGRKPKRFDPRTIQLKHYLLPGAPPAPPSVEYYQNRLGPNWGMMKNDSVGCCTIATAGHLTMLWTASDRDEFIPSDGQVIADYSAITGYNPDDPSTDQGANILDVLNFWRTPGMMAEQIEGYAAVDITNAAQVKQAVFAFGGIYIGFNVPQSAMDQFTAGQPWDVVANDGGIVGGHAVPVLGYDDTYLYVITWGQVQKMTWAFWNDSAYVDEAYSIASRFWLDKMGAKLNGYGVEDFRKNLNLMPK